MHAEPAQIRVVDWLDVAGFAATVRDGDVVFVGVAPPHAERWRELGRALVGRGRIGLRMMDDVAADLDFLDAFPPLALLDLPGGSRLRDARGLERLATSDLVRLAFRHSPGTRSLGLGVVARFAALRTLSVGGDPALEPLRDLPKLRLLSLTRCKRDDLSDLVGCDALEELILGFGRFANVGHLGALPKLRILEMTYLRDVLETVVGLERLTTLERLALGETKALRSLPSLRALERLAVVAVTTLRGLADLQPIADAPHLEEAIFASMQHLDVAAFDAFVGHPTLRDLWLNLGIRKDAAVYARLGLERPDVAARAAPRVPSTAWQGGATA